MDKRKLKRQLNLAQVVMLVTVGAIGAQIFVLTVHAAALSGPASILAILVGGLLSYSIALNYGELAYSFPVTKENAKITAFHTYPKITDAEEVEDMMLTLRQFIAEELRFSPARVLTRIVRAKSVTAGILDETKRQPYDLLVMGDSEEYGSGTRLFGSVDDWIVEHVENCSVLLTRHHELEMMHWMRRHLKMIGKDRFDAA